MVRNGIGALPVVFPLKAAGLRISLWNHVPSHKRDERSQDFGNKWEIHLRTFLKAKPICTLLDPRLTQTKDLFL